MAKSALGVGMKTLRPSKRPYTAGEEFSRTIAPLTNPATGSRHHSWLSLVAAKSLLLIAAIATTLLAYPMGSQFTLAATGSRHHSWLSLVAAKSLLLIAA